MKCIQAVKATKNVEVGTIIRIDDKEADMKVKGGYWKYVPKSEWKKTKSTSSSETPEQSESKEKVQSKKAEKRSKLKEKQRQ